MTWQTKAIKKCMSEKKDKKNMINIISNKSGKRKCSEDEEKVMVVKVKVR